MKSIRKDDWIDGCAILCREFGWHHDHGKESCARKLHATTAGMTYGQARQYKTRIILKSMRYVHISQWCHNGTRFWKFLLDAPMSERIKGLLYGRSHPLLSWNWLQVGCLHMFVSSFLDFAQACRQIPRMLTDSPHNTVESGDVCDCF